MSNSGDYHHGGFVYELKLFEVDWIDPSLLIISDGHFVYIHIQFSLELQGIFTIMYINDQCSK